MTIFIQSRIPTEFAEEQQSRKIGSGTASAVASFWLSASALRGTDGFFLIGLWNQPCLRESRRGRDR
jgi:hypothetical protein